VNRVKPLTRDTIATETGPRKRKRGRRKRGRGSFQQTGKAIGRKKWRPEDLRQQGDYWHCADTRQVKLYSKQNPAELHGSIELALRRKHGQDARATRPQPEAGHPRFAIASLIRSGVIGS